MHFLNFKTYISLLLITITIFFQGCAKDKDVAQNIPQWYMNPPSNNAIVIYGTALGDSIKEARDKALNDMSSRLLVNISSEIQTNTFSSNSGIYTKDISQNLKVEVEKIQYTDIKVEKTLMQNGKYYLQISTNRTKLFDENIKKFYSADYQISNFYKNLSEKSAYEKIFAFEEITPKIIENKKMAFVLYAIDNSFNYVEYLKKYADYENEIMKIKESISINITSNEEKNYFLNELINLFNIDKYNITDKNHSDIEVHLNNNVRYSEIKGWQIAKVSTTISIIANNKIFSNATIETLGRSSSTKENALAAASKSFKTELEKMTLKRLLFNKQ